MKLTSKHSGTGPATLAALIHAAQAGKEVLVVDTGLLGLTQLIGENIEHELTVTIGVDVTVGLKIQMLAKISGVDQVTVVCKADTIGAINVEWLSFGIGTGACGRVSQMANSHEARQVGNLSTVMEHLGSHAIGFELVKPTPGRTCCYTSCILTAICAEPFSLAIALKYLIAETHVGEGRVPRGDPRQPKMRGSPGSMQ